MRYTTKEWIEQVRQWIESEDKEAVLRAANHPKLLYSSIALSAVARTGDQDLLEYTLEHALGAGIMDLTNVLKAAVHAGHVDTTQTLLNWAESNNTFDAHNPYLRTVLMAAVENDCVEIWLNNAQQLNSIPKGLMKTYYFKAIESESLRFLEHIKEHVDTTPLQLKAFELAVIKLKKSSLEYLLHQDQNSSVKAASLTVQVCMQHNVLTKNPIAPEITSMLLMLMDYASVDQIMGRYKISTMGSTQLMQLSGILEHINTTVRAEQQAERLNLQLNGVQSSFSTVGRKL